MPAVDDELEDEAARELAHAVAQVASELRHERGWSLETLADEAGLHRTYIGLVERGERHLSLAAARRVAIGLGLPLSVLVQMAEARVNGDAPIVRFEPRVVPDGAVRNTNAIAEACGLDGAWIAHAVTETYARLDVIDEQLLNSGSPPLAELVELANLSAMIGNVLRAALSDASNGAYRNNEPHTYPDLLAQSEDADDLEIKVALETNKPKGHLPKPGPHLTCRYVLGDREGGFERGERGNVAWIYEIRLGHLEEDDFSISNTAGDSGKTAVIRTASLDALTCVYFDDRFQPYARPRPGHEPAGATNLFT